MRLLRNLTGLATIGLLFGSASVLPAQTLFQNSTGIASPATTITFSEHVLATGANVTTQYSDLGVTFSPNLFYSPQIMAAPHFDSRDLGDYYPVGGMVVPFDIKFNTVQTDAAFALLTNPGTTTFQALLNGNLVGSGTAPTNYTQTTNFYGFTGGHFDTIRVTPGGAGQGALLDNLQFGSVTPEGDSLAMLAMGGLPIAAGLGRKFRRKKA